MPDALSPLARVPVPLEVGGRSFPLPWRPAAEWTGVKAETDVISFLPDWAREEVGRMVFNGLVSVRALADAAHGVLELVTGRRWWEAYRLLQMSLQPETLGHLTLAGVDPWQRSAYEWCAAVYALHTKHADEKARMSFDFRLSIPPRGYEDVWAADGGTDPEDVQRALAAWMGG